MLGDGVSSRSVQGVTSHVVSCDPMHVLVSITLVEDVPVLGLGRRGVLPKVGQYLVVTFAMHKCVYTLHVFARYTYILHCRVCVHPTSICK